MTTPPAQPEDAALRKRFIEEYMEIARGFYFEGSDERDEREEFAPAWADKMMQLFREHERKAETAARIDELKYLDTLTYSFMSLGNDFDYSYRQSAIDERIKELQTTQPPADTPQPSNELCFDCGNKTFWYDNAYRCIYDGAWHEAPPAADATKQGEGE